MGYIQYSGSAFRRGLTCHEESGLFLSPIGAGIRSYLSYEGHPPFPYTRSMSPWACMVCFGSHVGDLAEEDHVIWTFWAAVVCVTLLAQLVLLWWVVSCVVYSLVESLVRPGGSFQRCLGQNLAEPTGWMWTVGSLAIAGLCFFVREVWDSGTSLPWILAAILVWIMCHQRRMT